MENSKASVKSKWGILIIVYAVALLSLSPAFGETAQQQKSGSPKVAEPKPAVAIPLAEVATRAAEASSFIRTLEIKLTPSPEIKSIQEPLHEVSEAIRQEALGTMKVLHGQPTFIELQVQQEVWQRMQSQVTGWLNVLDARSSELRQAQDRLADLQKVWSKTRDAAQASNAPTSILNQIDELLGTIDATQSSLESQLSEVLDLQSRVAQQATRCETALARIVQAQKLAMTEILTRDGLPIWSFDLWAQAENTLPASLQEIVNKYWTDIQHYFRNPSLGMPLNIGIFVLLSLLFCLAERRAHRWEVATEEESSSSKVFARPYSAALMGSLFFATRTISATPVAVQKLFEVLEFIPMIRLTQPVIDPRLMPSVYILWLLFFMDTMRQAFAGAPLVGQAILLLEAMAGVFLVGWALIFGHLRPIFEREKATVRMQVFAMGVSLGLLILTAAFLAGAIGYTRLAGLLVSAVIVGATFGLIIYVFFRVLCDVVTFILRVWPLRLLRMVKQQGALTEQRVRRVLVWMAILGWVARFLGYVGLLESALSFGGVLLTTKLERGSISISLEDVLAFLLTVWIAYLLSAFIRFILKEDVYPRLKIGQGVSYAISSLLNYVILALGVVVGMGLMGVNLSKVTVLAGAFGVGIGFGLQSVVSNFVCGLILLFERPIHVGDLIEFGDQLAEVRRIGIRASTLRTRRGADLIVPNSQLVTDKVTNWTLGDRLRRIQLPVGVNYGADPKKVIALLRDVARNHPKVLAYPPARALFMSYGDSSLNFELRAWTDEFLDWRYLRSDIAAAVYDAVKEAGMSFPFPQRDVHLLQDVPLTVAEVEVGGDLAEPKNEESASDLSNVRSPRSGVAKTGDKEGSDL